MPPAYRRLSRRAELLIAEVYLASVDTSRARRALQTLFGGRIGKDAVSRLAEDSLGLAGLAGARSSR